MTHYAGKSTNHFRIKNGTVLTFDQSNNEKKKREKRKKKDIASFIQFMCHTGN